MSRIKYLIVAELNKKGFLIGWRNHLKSADLLKERIYRLSDKFAWPDIEQVEGELEYFDSYQIRGNEHYADRMETVHSDGKFSLYVFRVPDIDSFHVDQFKREREYASTVFPHNRDYKKLNRVLELIEHTSFVAN